MRTTSTPTILAEVVTDIIQKMTEADKATVVNTAEENLIEFHFGWGTSIRNCYNLWQNQALLRATGAENPDDASMVIIKAIWKALRDSGETYRKGKIELDTLHWREMEQCLEIKTEGRSLIIYGLGSETATQIANALRLSLLSSESYTSPYLAPRPILEKQNLMLQVWSYLGHPDNS